MKNLHIVNGQSAAGTLKFVLNNHKDYKSDIVYCFPDFLSVGPLFQIETSIGQQKRSSYVSEMIHKIDSDFPLNEVTNTVSEFVNYNFSDYDTVTIWHGNNAPERILKFLCCKIIEHKKLYEVAMSKLQTEGEVPWAVGECTIDCVENLLSLSNKITQEDYVLCSQKWDELTSSESKLRIYTNDAIKNVPENYYDQLIIEQCTNEFTLALKIVGIVLGKSKQLIGDVFITFRLLKLLEEKKLNYKGDLNKIRTLLVKI